MRLIKIKHPDWLKMSRPEETLQLFRKGMLPDCIAGWMIVVVLKRPLRAIYGSDLRAALALLWQATGGSLIESADFWIWENITHRAEAQKAKGGLTNEREG